ncbi:DUF899 domain-containing protein [Streptomyces sp. CB03911]|uniref:DUF899 domain-containing protein n=1 Tax=Streptomycetaceae TaxID=2062 RepID=UPI00093FCB0D|nr:DUF899 domain-containing protein [Streptomyces sp. CB03911]OKI28926.1 hypothetical protein A6A07_26115 [Streptomyces sp. CB03911]
MNLPKVATREEWLQARKELLEKEKQLTRLHDEVVAARPELPMVKVDKDYVFHGPQGELSLLDLFQGRRQLIVRHFMFGPDQEEGCIGCSMQADSVGHLAHINARETTFVMVSRGQLPKLEAFKARMGWDIPWVSSFGSDFNVDYHVTTEQGELPGVSVFMTDGTDVFHTYSIYDRGGDIFKNFYNYLDLTPLGRQEAQLEQPWDWWRHHDMYDNEAAATAGTNWWNGTDKFAS